MPIQYPSPCLNTKKNFLIQVQTGGVAKTVRINYLFILSKTGICPECSKLFHAIQIISTYLYIIINITLSGFLLEDEKKKKKLREQSTEKDSEADSDDNDFLGQTHKRY